MQRSVHCQTKTRVTRGRAAYKVGQVNVALRIQQDVVWFHISVDNALIMDVAQSAAKFGDPEADGRFGEAFSGYVEAEITSAHQINDQISGHVSRLSRFWKDGSTTYR